MLRVPRPRLKSMRRAVPGQVSVGDTASALLEPGLMGLLEAEAAGGCVGGSPGEGYHARFNLPIGLASTAAVAILAPSVESGGYWAGRDLDVEFLAAAGPGDAVIAEARLEESNGRIARLRIWGRTDRNVDLFRGTLRMMAVREGRPAGFRSQADTDAVRSQLARSMRPEQPIHGRFLGAVRVPDAIRLGDSAFLEAVMTNTGSVPVVLTVTVEPPFGAGLSIGDGVTRTVTVGPGEQATSIFTIQADRPHEVNLGRPWPVVLRVSGDGHTDTAELRIRVADPNPGRIFYLLTEDCETFDGGEKTGDYGELGELGSRNNFMDPEDYRVQMIRKAERMNEIAERHGARFTHCYAATQRFAAEWAASQSRTGVWPQIVQELDASVRRGAEIHEYCPHMHFDYEPEATVAPQPRLLYDAATDGIIPNQYWDPVSNPTHCYHDWDGAARGIEYIKPLGNFTVLESKAGSLRKITRHLARLQANQRSTLVGRTGTLDFGGRPEDQEISTRAYEANGLRGNSDGYHCGGDPLPGGSLYWCDPGDRQKRVGDLRQARLVQLGITMETMFASAEDMNEWFAKQWQSCGGPGVHAVLFTTHAMFLRGEPDPFRSLEGGAFEQLDQHLDWVRANYPEAEFATASEAVLEYLDYYTPRLDAHVEPLLVDGDLNAGVCVFPIRLLGRGIRVSAAHPATLRIAAPACFSPQAIGELRVRAGERVLATASGFSALYQTFVEVTLTDRDAPLTLEVRLKPALAAREVACFLDDSGKPLFHEAPEARQPDLFRIREDSISVSEAGHHTLEMFPDVARLLMNPIAGHPEPLGRRVHPLGAFPLSAALTAAFQAAGESRPSAPVASEPSRLKLRWLREVKLDAVFSVEAKRAETDVVAVRIRDDNGALVAEADVTVVTAPGGPPAVPAPSTSGPVNLGLAQAASFRRGVRDYQAALNEALVTYRSQRAWTVMLVCRKAYTLLLRRGWKGRLEFFRWLPAVITGRGMEGLEEFELRFPDVEMVLGGKRKGS